MQTAFIVNTPVNQLVVGDFVWRTNRGYVRVDQVSWEIDDTWMVWFAGGDPVSFVEDDTLPVKQEVE